MVKCQVILFVFLSNVVLAQGPGKDSARVRRADSVKVAASAGVKGKILAAVEVKGTKPVIQMETDRLRFNVAGSDLVAGNTIWGVIEKTPLVRASEDGAIQISGTSGAVVYINNKKKVLSGMALKAYLSAMPSDNLEAIEVITTPSSKYDAEGGAGILNIITRKKKEEGFDGNATLTMRETAVNSQSGSVFLNNRSGKWDIYSSLYLVNRRRKPESSQDIYFPGVGGAGGSSGGLLSREISTKEMTRSFSSGANVGIDHQINQRHVVGLLFDFAGSWDKKGRGSYSYDRWSGADSLSFSDNQDRLNSQTYSLNLNYEGKLDSSGRKLNVDFDALHYVSSNHSISKTDALDLLTEKDLFVQDYFRSQSPQQVDNQSLKADYHWPLGKRMFVELGAKVSYSQINNDLLFENNTGGMTWVKDDLRSNLFKYDERIGAAYLVLNQKISALWSYQVGTRVENTVAKGYLQGNLAVDRNYTNAFPTAYLKYSPSQRKSYGLTVSSRITRPSYWDVNPFRTYTTDKTYFEGNPFLRPSRYHREELSHVLNTSKATYTFQVAASQTLDEFYSLPYGESGDVIVNKRTNYGNKYGYTGTAIYYSRIRPWWQLSGTVLGGYVVSKGGYAGIPIDNETWLLSVSTNQTFTISKKGRLTCTVIANNTLPATIVNTRVGDRFETEFRIRKGAGPFNISLAAIDLFKSNKDNFMRQAGDLRMTESYYYDTRSVLLTVNYNFGKSTVREKRDRDTEFENVKSRLM
ncbi:MAG: outer membrane beta-barrel protein [Bacteroidetes bacterium]|nr:outer membrane beta-barrel protein [Bacteroidota bacterium]